MQHTTEGIGSMHKGLLLVAALSLTLGTSAATEPPSLLIVNGRVLDGTGTPASDASIRIAGARIVEIGDLHPRDGEKVLDAASHTVAPGFIDCHSHLDRNILDRPDAAAAVTQGVTTVIIGADGFSRYPLAGFFKELARNPPAVNVASFTGHNTLRAQVMPKDDDRRPANSDEVLRMRRLLEDEMRTGSLGLSTGLAYESGVFSDTSEIIELARSAARRGILASHIRNESAGVSDAIGELLGIGEAAHVPVHVSHIKIAMMRLWGLAPEILATLNRAREAGIDVSADVYPYAQWQTTMRILFPDKRFDDPSGPAMNFRDTVRPEDLILQRYLPDTSLAGRTIADIALERSVDPVKLYLDLTRAALDYESAHPDEAGQVESVIGKGMDERDIEAFLTWPHSSICSDGADGGHPRGYGTFTRVLGRYVREREVLTLEAAVHKMTMLTADRFGLADRGALRTGAFADVVIFDPEVVLDQSTIEQPTAPSTGIELVMINGKVVYQDGEWTGARPGRIVRRDQQ